MWTVNSDIAVPVSISEKTLMNFMNDNFLCQYVNVPTRNQNILDLVLTNNDRLIQHVKSEKHALLSDHNLVEIIIPQNEIGKIKVPVTDVANLQDFNALDLLNANYDDIAKDLKRN